MPPVCQEVTDRDLLMVVTAMLDYVDLTDKGPEYQIQWWNDRLFSGWHYGEPPTLGMVTFINRAAVRPTMVRGTPVWGWTYRKAGFVEVGETKRRRYLALQLLPDAMPPPAPARPRLGEPRFDFGAADGEAA